MGIYQPFTYHLYHRPTGKHYYGVRFKRGCSPSELWTTYFSSSKRVKDLIKQFGADSFDYEVRKVFVTAKEARSWEERVLRRLRVLYNDKWLNVSINGAIILTPEHIKELAERRRGTKASDETKAKMSQTRRGRKQTPEHARRRGEAIKGRVFTDEWREKLRASQYRKRDWTFIDPIGNIITISDLRRFCEENCLSYGSMLHVANGRNRQHKGFTQAPTPVPS